MSEVGALLAHITSLRVPSPEVRRRVTNIHHTLLRESACLDRPNFGQIHPEVLERAFALYDARFFGHKLGPALRTDGGTVSFRFSKRMTRVGGTASFKRIRGRSSYEIALSSILLFETFQDDAREITVNGMVCRNRLEALQRIFEHELIHLVEFRVWNRSSCSRPRFRDLAHRVFAHTETTHRLVTPRERAAVTYGVKVGAEVGFAHQGRQLRGVVARITRRATVLVRDPAGQLYSDGRHYVKYYVPLGELHLDA